MQRFLLFGLKNNFKSDKAKWKLFIRSSKKSVFQWAMHCTICQFWKSVGKGWVVLRKWSLPSYPSQFVKLIFHYSTSNCSFMNLEKYSWELLTVVLPCQAAYFIQVREGELCRASLIRCFAKALHSIILHFTPLNYSIHYNRLKLFSTLHISF